MYGMCCRCGDTLCATLYAGGWRLCAVCSFVRLEAVEGELSLLGFLDVMRCVLFCTCGG